ncbi:MAG: Ig-like domain-containing protein [Spirochaetes bacterium]|nr:Ig-like domain-containing protein [Spirochaetota bacterium]
MKRIFHMLFIFFFSCSQFETLKIVSHIPSNGEYDVAPMQTVRIEFNNAVNKPLIENNFILKENNISLEGRFQWESPHAFRFIPHRQFTNASRCVIELPRTIEDVHGNTMERDFILEFYVGKDVVSPRILASIPPYAEGGTKSVPVDITSIEIFFSEPMDTIATSTAFRITPDASGYIEWNEENTQLKYRLQEKLEYGTQYRVTISTTAKDRAGNPLEKNFTLFFLAGENFTPPLVRGAYESGTIPPPYFDLRTLNRNVSRFSSIAIEFSKPMDPSSVENAFSIKPHASGKFHWSGGNSIFTFSPDAPLGMETAYTITISPSAKDTRGLTLREIFSVQFKTDAPDSIPFRVAMIEGSYDSKTSQYQIIFDGSSLAWPLHAYMGPLNQLNPNDYFLRVHFANAVEPVKVNLHSLIESVMIEGEGSPCIVDVELSDEGNVATIALDGLVNIRNPHTKDPVLYRLTIAGGVSGLKDSRGNTMKESFICEFKDTLDP